MGAGVLIVVSVYHIKQSRGPTSSYPCSKYLDFPLLHTRKPQQRQKSMRQAMRWQHISVRRGNGTQHQLREGYRGPISYLLIGVNVYPNSPRHVSIPYQITREMASSYPYNRYSAPLYQESNPAKQESPETPGLGGAIYPISRNQELAPTPVTGGLSSAQQLLLSP